VTFFFSYRLTHFYYRSRWTISNAALLALAQLAELLI